VLYSANAITLSLSLKAKKREKAPLSALRSNHSHSEVFFSSFRKIIIGQKYISEEKRNCTRARTINNF
jgi:hypothetical protein